MKYGRFCLLTLIVVLLIALVKADIDQSTTITGASYLTTGSATTSGAFIQVTQATTGQAGIALYQTQQTISGGFYTTFSYESTSCSATAAYGYGSIINYLQ
ncbi:hypothetical protein HW132_34985 [Brasilonema sp. CT11]|nr:hypothetical protein [Brasilonema sp. CT11]